MKIKLLMLFICALFLISVTGCTKEENTPLEDEKKEEKSKGNCEVAECMKLLNPEMKIEEMNQIIGFEGEKQEENDTYIWQLTSKTKITVEFKNGFGTIDATYEKEKLKNADLKFSLCYDIANHIKEKNYTYKEMVEKLEGIEGNLESYSKTSKMYSWINKDGQTLRATFSESANWKCSIVSIR